MGACEDLCYACDDDTLNERPKRSIGRFGCGWHIHPHRAFHKQRIGIYETCDYRRYMQGASGQTQQGAEDWVGGGTQ